MYWGTDIEINTRAMQILPSVLGYYQGSIRCVCQKTAQAYLPGCIIAVVLAGRQLKQHCPVGIVCIEATQNNIKNQTTN